MILNPSSYRPISNLNTIIILNSWTSIFIMSLPSCHVLKLQSPSICIPPISTQLKLLFFKHLITYSTLLTSVTPTLLASLDLSAAFDTIDHATLLSWLSTSFGVHGTAFAWLTSSEDSYRKSLSHQSILPHKSFSNCLHGLCVIQSFQLFFWCATGLSPRTNFIFSLYLPQSVSNFGLAHQSVCWWLPTLYQS